MNTVGSTEHGFSMKLKARGVSFHTLYFKSDEGGSSRECREGTFSQSADVDSGVKIRQCVYCPREGSRSAHPRQCPTSTREPRRSITLKCLRNCTLPHKLHSSPRVVAPDASHEDIGHDVRRDLQVHAMQHVDHDSRHQQTDDHAEQRRQWPSLREQLCHVSCVRPPGGTPTRTVANSCQEETDRPRSTHCTSSQLCVPLRESEDRAQKLPVATALDQASAPPFSHTAPSTWHLVAAPVPLWQNPREQDVHRPTEHFMQSIERFIRQVVLANHCEEPPPSETFVRGSTQQ